MGESGGDAAGYQETERIAASPVDPLVAAERAQFRRAKHGQGARREPDARTPQAMAERNWVIAADDVDAARDVQRGAVGGQRPRWGMSPRGGQEVRRSVRGAPLPPCFAQAALCRPHRVGQEHHEQERAANAGFNFDGGANGHMIVTVPFGAKIVARYRNAATTPHDVRIINS